jgi:hypothetical protein
VGDEIPAVLAFFENVREYTFNGPEKVNVTDAELRRIALSREQALTFVKDNQEIVAEAVKAGMTLEDVEAFAYRRRQLDVFRRLLNERAFFESVKEKKGCKGDEAVWQAFFQKNEWIFGYGLSYAYVSSFDSKKLEQYISGHDLLSSGKRADAVLRSRGIISALCFVEIKTHDKTSLLGEQYRAGCWAPSRELVGAIAQVQCTVAAAAKEWQIRMVPKDKDGNPTGEEVFNVKPRAFIVIGSLRELTSEHGVNEDKMRSFELFRNSIEGIEIVTFDELYERSRFIVDVRQVKDQFASKGDVA